MSDTELMDEADEAAQAAETVDPPPPTRRPASERRQLATLVLTMIAALCCATIVEATVLSGLQHVAAQDRAFAAFRGAVASGVAPVGQNDQEGGLLELGTPMALLEIPAIGLREVVGEGTTSGVLADGPGHSRTTPFPGQAGTSVVMGRRAAFGGPFKRLPRLEAGDSITVTTGQGISTYQVTAIRRAGDPLPAPLPAGQGRLVLATADGAAFVPSGAVYVDADLTTTAYPSPGRVQAALDPRERPMGTDRAALWPLLLWVQIMIGVVLGLIWSWSRWGRLQTWIVFVPLMALAGIEAAAAFLQLLPNLT